MDRRGLYDLIFTDKGFIRGGRYDENRLGRWHEEDCLGRGDDCTCRSEAIEQHYNDKADLEMNDESVRNGD